MTDLDIDIIRRAAFLQTQSACAIVEAIALLVEQGVDSHFGGAFIQQKGDEVRALIDKYSIGPNAVLTYLEGK